MFNGKRGMDGDQWDAVQMKGDNHLRRPSQKHGHCFALETHFLEAVYLKFACRSSGIIVFGEHGRQYKEFSQRL